MKTILIITGLIISQTGFTQPKVKLYGYSQEFMPGMVPQRDIPDENGGQPIKRPVTVIQYSIFSVSSADIQPKELLMGGNWYKITGSAIQSTPVLSADAEKKQLVPRTNLKVLRIDKGDTVNNIIKISPAIKKIVDSNELVVSYLWKGKKYYASLKKLVILAPLHAE